MFQRFINRCRRITGSKGFRRGMRIFGWLFAVYYIYNITLYLIAVMSTGATLQEALRFFFSLSLIENSRMLPSASIFLGVGIGLIWYFRRKDKKSEAEAPAEQERTAEESESYQEAAAGQARFHSD